MILSGHFKSHTNSFLSIAQYILKIFSLVIFAGYLFLDSTSVHASHANGLNQFQTFQACKTNDKGNKYCEAAGNVCVIDPLTKKEGCIPTYEVLTDTTRKKSEDAYCSEMWVGTGNSNQDAAGVPGCGCISTGGTACGKHYISGNLSSSGFTFPAEPNSVCVDSYEPDFGSGQAKRLLCVSQQAVSVVRTGASSAPGGSQTGGSAALTQPKKVWTKQECEGVMGKNGEPAYQWIPPKSEPGATSGNHCYIKPLKTNLQIHIGDNYVIEGLNNYINIAYKYALGLGVIIMIITIMFSGIQWMTSGIASSINDAKQRIQNAALGLLLLFGANTLLYTINPQLVQMRLPLMNAIRPDAFDVVKKEDAKRCDPVKEDSCSKYGPKYKCKPTEYYALAKCQAQFKGLMAFTFGSAAVVAAAPFAITAGTAAVTQTGSGTILRNVASTAVQEGAELIVNQTTNSDAGTAAGAAADAAGVGGGTSKLGKAVKIGKGVLAVAGAALAADYIISNWPEDASAPANGYCVEIKPEKPDQSICQFDGECQSQKCLLTSKGACGAGSYGVCVSGQLGQMCVLKNSYPFGVLSNESEADKFKCNNSVPCVDNGRGATKNGYGMCSDGGSIGMACDDDHPCKSLKNPLECIKGFCREKGYFDSNGVMISTDLSAHPRCIVPTDCSDAKVTSMYKAQGGTMSGCLKYPSKDLNLPGRLLVPVLNGKPDNNLFRELSTYGVCVIDTPTFKPQTATGVAAQPYKCFVNVYPDKGFYDDEKVIANYLASKSLLPGGNYVGGFRMGRVGCGTYEKEKTSKGACVIAPGSIKAFANDFANNSFITVQGECAAGSDKGIKIEKVNGSDAIVVKTLDTEFGGVKLPNLVDLQYTFAGEAKYQDRPLEHS